jgi:hypothetical protein
VTTPGATEYDLREYLYDWLPRKERLPRDVEKALPVSLGVWCAWLAANEGVSYPWAAAVLDEYHAVAQARGAAPADAWWSPAVSAWRSAFWGDVDARVMQPDRDLPGTRAGWPPVMDPDVARLRNELARRWLIWYDEAVRMGVTDLDVLWEVLAGRQRGWENTPNPAVGGRTPRQVVAEFEEQAIAKGRLALNDDGTVSAPLLHELASFGGDDDDDDDDLDDTDLDLFADPGESRVPRRPD